MLSGGADGASLEQKGMADVTHADRSGVRGQSQLIAGAAVAVDVSTVPAMVLQTENQELSYMPKTDVVTDSEWSITHFSPSD